MNRTVQEFNKRMHDEWFEQRFIALRPRNGTMIFLGWNETKQLYVNSLIIMAIAAIAARIFCWVIWKALP